MKKTDFTSYVTIGISVLALVLLFAGFQMTAAFVALPAVVMIGFSAHKSGPVFTAATFLAPLVAGIAIDYPFKTFPAALVFFPLIGVALHVRNWFFHKMFLYKAMKLEMIFILCIVAGFIITAALFSAYKWQQWVAGGIPALLYGMFSSIIYKDREEARRMVAKMDAPTGRFAPDFTLKDQDGNPVSLKDILSAHHALLVFVRGDWCPTCHMMLRGYVKNKEKFAEKNVKIVGIGPDPQGVNKDIMSRIDEHSLMLSDDNQETAEKFSLALQANNPITKPMYKKGIPLPASFLVHSSGKIIYSSRSDKAAEILQPDKIFEVLNSI